MGLRVKSGLERFRLRRLRLTVATNFFLRSCRLSITGLYAFRYFRNKTVVAKAAAHEEILRRYFRSLPPTHHVHRISCLPEAI